MSRRITRTARGVFAALVGAGLTFGAGSVLAAPAAAADCPVNPLSSQYGLTCTTHASCTSACSNYLGVYSPGRCYGGCCTCLL